MTGSRIHLLTMAACCAAGLVMPPAAAQQQPGGWQAETRAPGAFLPGLARRAARGTARRATRRATRRPADYAGDRLASADAAGPAAQHHRRAARTRNRAQEREAFGQVSLPALLTDDGRASSRGWSGASAVATSPDPTARRAGL